MATLTLALPKPFELRLALFGHGWIALQPHGWSEQQRTWTTVLRIGQKAFAVSTRQQSNQLRVQIDGNRTLTPRQLETLRRQLRHMLRLDEDLTPFWQLCRQTKGFHWVARRGGGRLLRSPTVFEDLMKLLFTTNCSWSLTEALTRNLVQAIGPRAKGGQCAFPTATECAQNEAFYRDVVRAGYRSRACVELAEAFAAGERTDADFVDPELPTDLLRQRLLALRGFGPYAAGQAMRLLGRYDDLAIDSWCRARITGLLGRSKPPSDQAIAHRYRSFGAHAGLGMWCELTADWHDEKTRR
jgi:3-methyladenine DNA glycosylase/8-oxoguanine DNA glycosylase